MGEVEGDAEAVILLFRCIHKHGSQMVVVTSTAIREKGVDIAVLMRTCHSCKPE